MGAGHTHPLHVHGHSAVHRLPAHLKVLAALAVAVAVAITPVGAWWVFAALAVVVGAGLAAAHLPVTFVASRALVVTPFVLSGLLVPLIASGHDATIGPVSYSTEGLAAGLSIAARSLLGVSVSILLVGTTELPHLLAALERLRVPATLVAIASFLLRYLELVADDLHRMRRAMQARGHDPRWWWQLRPLATAAGALFIRTFERGERVHLAMQARGFTGRMPAGESAAVTRMQVAGVAAWALTAIAVAVVGRAA